MPSFECEVCLECYNDFKRVPRTLSCGHTLCTSCIAKIMRRKPLKCPFCRMLHSRVICPADVPLHDALVMRVVEAVTTSDAGQDVTSEVSQLSVLKLRDDVKKASASGNSVWALRTADDGSSQCARISLINNRLHLHALKDDRPPSDSHTIPYNMIQELLDEDFIITFFEVSWAGHAQGRVYIALLDDAGRTRQFRFLCSGELGPSYAGTRFLEVILKGMPGEQVWGGDYEENDGSGGAALPGMERGDKNNQDITAGLVAGFYFTGYGQDHNPSHFGIYVKDKPGYVEMSSIGMVVEGLQIISAASAELEDIQEACVSDCGFLLSH